MWQPEWQAQWLWVLAPSTAEQTALPSQIMALIEHCVRGQRPAVGSSAWVSFLSWLLSKIFTLCLSSKMVPRSQWAEGAGKMHPPPRVHAPSYSSVATHPMGEPG